MRVKILAYKGKSFWSRMIKLRTWSDVSHVAIELDSNNVVEAWSFDGVVHRKGYDAYKTGHTKGTEIDVYEVPKQVIIDGTTYDVDHEKIWKYAVAQVGKSYDWMAILGFGIRKHTENPEKLFCSELVHAACLAGGLVCHKGPSFKQSPHDIATSAVLPFIEERVV